MSGQEQTESADAPPGAPPGPPSAACPSADARPAGQWLWWVLLAPLAAVLAVATVALRPLLHPEPLLVAPLDPSCDLAARPCTARFPDGGALTLDLEPRGIPPLRPLRLAVRTQGLPDGPVQVDFVGVDMDMGYNRPVLTAVGPGLYRGEGMLPICVRDRMAWEARVLIGTPGGMRAAPFRFETARRP